MISNESNPAPQLKCLKTDYKYDLKKKSVFLKMDLNLY